MVTALRAASLTLAHYLREQFEADVNLAPFFNPSLGGTMLVSLNTPQEMVDLQHEGLSLWLYRVVRDDQRLNDPPERISPNEIRRTPLPVRLHYLMTPVTNERTPSGPETRQVILGKVLQALHDHPTQRGADLQDDMSGTSVELTARLEPMQLDEMGPVWEMLEGTYQLALSYEVSVVTIESGLQPDVAAPVEVAIPRLGAVVR